MESVRKLPENPRATANIFSILSFWWTIDLFRTGYRKALELGDLFQPLQVDQSEVLGDRLEKKWKVQLKNSATRPPSLIKAVIFTFWREYAQIGVITILSEVVRILQPLLLGRLLQFFRKDNQDLTKDDAWLAAGGIVGISLFSAFNSNQFIYQSFITGMRIRIAMCSVIYRKATKLSQNALGDTAPGKVVNLLSNDVNRFDLVSVFIHSMWSAPLFAIVVGYLLVSEVGYAGLVGILAVFLVVPIQSYTGKLSSRFRLRTALKTDERVRFMDEILSGIQVIKMYAWEKPFSKLILMARKLELKVVKKNAYVRGLYMTFLLFTTRMALFATMLTMALTNEPITAANIFVVTAYFNILSQTMSQMFVRGFAEIAEVLVALGRLRAFLMYEEKGAEKKRGLIVSMNGAGEEEKKPGLLDDKLVIMAQNATARWSTPEEIRNMKVLKKKPLEKSGSEQTINFIPPTLENLNFKCERGTLIGVVGGVAAGKSSFLQAILRELPLESGDILVNGSVSYACQEPWVFASSVQQNILFGLEYEKDRYNAVVKACSLLTDFEQLQFGDKTVIGERGSSLSGGQKARVSLARAMYRDSDIYLLDDPLSAVDAHVGRHLFDECIGPKNKLTRHKTRILVTHQVHFLKDADWLIVLKDGQIEMQGPPNQLFKEGKDMEQYLELLDGDSDSDEDVLNESSLNGSSDSLSSSQRSLQRSSRRSRRSSRMNTSRGSRRSSRSSLNQPDDAEAEEEKQKLEDEKADIARHMNLEQSSRNKVPGSIFMKYLRAGGNNCVVFIIFVLFLVTQLLASCFDWFVSFWTRQEELGRIYNAWLNVSETIGNGTESPFETIAPAEPLLTTEMCLYIQGTLVCLVFLVGICRSFSFYSLCIRSSENLHTQMFQGVVSAKMRFFDTNPSGRILNRFSKDMGAVDEWLPKVMLDSGQIVLSLLGAVVVAVIVHYLFLIPIIVLAMAFMFVRKIYLKTSKNIKRLDGITRSPVFTHLGATLTGLSTIRAYNAQDILIKEFDGLQDIHTATWFMFLATSSAFGFFLDILSVGFVGFVTFTFMILPGDTMGDSVGLAITQVLVLTGLVQWGIRQSAEVANHLMSVERILEYKLLEPETEPEKAVSPPDPWPSNGKLALSNVVYKYFPEGEPVLKGIDLVVQPKEKVGIVGRTGAGKSSLIGTIFRLGVVDGDIVIDGVNTANISLETLRSRVSIIPQDPVLFSGTLRRNLDPFEEYPDENLWSALNSVELKDIAGPAGLQTEVLAGGSNFSVGQRQLLCLARAILRNNKILVLDEATANVDPKTDSLIQETIRHRFADCTVLTVAHRLHTIMDSDKVLVMDQGLVNQFDAPHLLLQDENGVLSGMVKATGAQESERLREVAKHAYESKSKTA